MVMMGLGNELAPGKAQGCAFHDVESAPGSQGTENPATRLVRARGNG
jgi:hypothetical protein